MSQTYMKPKTTFCPSYYVHLRAVLRKSHVSKDFMEKGLVIQILLVLISNDGILNHPKQECLSGLHIGYIHQIPISYQLLMCMSVHSERLAGFLHTLNYCKVIFCIKKSFVHVYFILNLF